MNHDILNVWQSEITDGDTNAPLITLREEVPLETYRLDIGDSVTFLDYAGLSELADIVTEGLFYADNEDDDLDDDDPDIDYICDQCREELDCEAKAVPEEEIKDIADILLDMENGDVKEFSIGDYKIKVTYNEEGS